MNCRPYIERFWEKVEKTDSCWLWTAYINVGGYGRLAVNGKYEYAHRVSYKLNFGPIPEGHQIDHLCRNRACVNPSHLEAVTQQENIKRGEGGVHNRIKTHCPKGHEYTPDNIYTGSRNRKPGRNCKACAKHRAMEQHKRERAA